VVPLRKSVNKYIVPTPPSIYYPYEPETTEKPGPGLDLTNPTIQLLRSTNNPRERPLQKLEIQAKCTVIRFMFHLAPWWV
jgi:hypothetical protein